MTTNTPKLVGLPWGGGQFYVQNVKHGAQGDVTSAASVQHGQHSTDTISSMMLLQGGEAGQGALIPRARPSAFTFYPDCPQPEMHASFQSLGSSQELTGLLI